MRGKIAQVGEVAKWQEFEKQFEGADFRKGLEIAFTSTKQGALATKVDNKDVSSSLRIQGWSLYLTTAQESTIRPAFL